MAELERDVEELECGHPIRVYHQDTPVVFDSKVPVYTQPQPAVPEGWKLVPIEPTHEMTEQGAQEADWYAHNAYDCYKAMLDAAPQPPKEGK